MRVLRLQRFAAAVLISAASALVCTSTAAADRIAEPASSVSQVPYLSGPAQTTHADASRYVSRNPGAVPVGVNEFACVPSPQHPRPVVLLHGTDSSAYSDFAALGPRLSAAGHCVFALNYGGRPGEANFGTEDIPTSAAQVAAFVDTVLTATGSSQVDIVGYSQGATVGRYFINTLDGARVVGRWVGLASPSYGSTLYGLVPLATRIPGAMDLAVTALPRELVSTALWQQAQGSAFLDGLNHPSDTAPGVEYTTIASQVDEVIQPTANVALRATSATNLVLQELCPGDLSGHFRMPYDEVTTSLVARALGPETDAAITCADVPLSEGVLEMVIAENF